MRRRDFLIAGLAAGGALAAPAKIRAAFFGTQHSHAAGKLKTLQDSGDYEVAGIHEPNPRARKTASELRRLSEEELLGDSGIQLVVVECSPSEAAAWGRRVISAGKHLHLEKPPGDELAPFRELVEEARRRKLLLQVGYIWRFHQGIGAAIDAARQGYLGEVFLVRGTINTDIGAESRTSLARYRGGMMFELGCHMIDRVVDLMGRPQEVRSWLRHDSTAVDKLADNTVAVFEYEKALAAVSSAARQPGASQQRSFEVIGTNGSVLVQPVEPGTKLQVTLRDARGPYRAGAQQVEMPPQPRYVGDFQDMARAIRSGQALKFSYDHEQLVQETLLRACG